jgi:hypothetical protein
MLGIPTTVGIVSKRIVNGHRAPTLLRALGRTIAVLASVLLLLLPHAQGAVAQISIVIPINVHLPNGDSATFAVEIPQGWRSLGKGPDTTGFLKNVARYRRRATEQLDVSIGGAATPDEANVVLHQMATKNPAARLDTRLQAVVWSSRGFAAGDLIQLAAMRPVSVGVKSANRTFFVITISERLQDSASAAAVLDSVLRSIRVVGRPAAPPQKAQAAPAATRPPMNEVALLASFSAACRKYDAQPNEILKSEVYRDTRPFIANVGPIVNWVGTLTSIKTNQGGSTATLTIRIGSSSLYVPDVSIGTPVYQAARGMHEGQRVVFSGSDLRDLNLTERGKVCEPDFGIKLTELR